MLPQRPPPWPHIGTLMTLLLLGSGGREHALAWKLADSPLVDRLYCAPGNAGIARDAQLVGLDAADHAAVVDFCKAERGHFVGAGPERPLRAGSRHRLEPASLQAFPPPPPPPPPPAP